MHVVSNHHFNRGNKMIVDIQKVGEDGDSICYRSVREKSGANVFLVNKLDASVAIIVSGDAESGAGVLAKIRRTVKLNDFPKKMLLVTG